MSRGRVLATLALVALCAAAGVGRAAPTGVRSALSETGLQYAAQVGLQILRQQLTTLTVPDIHQDVGTPIGSVTFDVTGITVSGITIPDGSVSVVANLGVNVDVSGLSAHATLNWHYREDGWPHVSDGGSADVQISGTTVSVTVAVGEASGRPTVSAASCSVNIGGLDIDLHGGASWLYQLFVNAFSGQIKSSVESSLHDAIVQAVNSQGEQALSTIPIVEKIDSTSEINFELTATPVFTSTYLGTAHLGEFYAISDPTEAPGAPVALPDTISTEMVQIMVSSFTINSAGFVYQKAGALSVVVNANEVPSWSPVQLNTSSFQILIPQLFKLYPDDLMQLVISSAAPPSITFSKANGAFVQFPTNILVNVITANGTVAAFTLGVTIDADAEASVSGTNLVATLSFLNTTISVVSSNVGQIVVEPIQDLINLVAKDGIIPLANKYAQKGFPLPVVQGVSFVSPTIAFNDGYVGVSSDIKYAGSMLAHPLRDYETVPLRIVHGGHRSF